MEKCNEKNCPCPKKVCENHGKCCECINKHREKQQLVYCMRKFANR